VAAVMSVQVLRGSAAPAVTNVHLPTEPASAQLRHPPVQAVLQQTPWPPVVSTTQLLFWHCAFAVQGCPSTFGPQLPLTQAMPSAQSALVTHLELQAPLAHRKLPHSCVSGVWQVPRPSQVRGALADVEVTQVAAAQGVPEGYSEQAPNPSHTPVLPQVIEACLAHKGCPWPAGIGLQVPGDATRLQERQTPSQALLQQTPLPLATSAQKPDAHSSGLAHSNPFIFLPHIPSTHLRPATQSASLVQAPKHAFVLRLQE
jgi:hypothetical protein